VDMVIVIVELVVALMAGVAMIALNQNVKIIVVITEDVM